MAGERGQRCAVWCRRPHPELGRVPLGRRPSSPAALLQKSSSSFLLLLLLRWEKKSEWDHQVGFGFKINAGVRSPVFR